jgi:hypothetical protein
VQPRVYELAKELGVTSDKVLSRLAEMGVYVQSTSSRVEIPLATRVKESFGHFDAAAEAGSATPRQASWNAGPVRPPTHPETLANLYRLKQAFSVVEDHQRALARLGSQFVYSTLGRVAKFQDCGYALVRFSEAIESAFGFTREVFFFYSPHPDLQIRTFRAANQALQDLRQREVTPDVMFLWSPDIRLREKLDDWSKEITTIPLVMPDDDDPLWFIKLVRDYIFERDLFYETTPVQGDPALVSRSRVAGVQATGASLACWSSYSIGVSIPSAVWRRRRLWNISRYSNRALASSRRVRHRRRSSSSV